jgi:hypothetical protein
MCQEGVGVAVSRGSIPEASVIYRLYRSSHLLVMREECHPSRQIRSTGPLPVTRRTATGAHQSAHQSRGASHRTLSFHILSDVAMLRVR